MRFRRRLDAENIVMSSHLGSRLLWVMCMSYGIRDILLSLLCNIGDSVSEQILLSVPQRMQL